MYDINVIAMQDSFSIVIVTNADYVDHVLYIFLLEKQGDYLSTVIVSESRTWPTSVQTSSALLRSG